MCTRDCRFIGQLSSCSFWFVAFQKTNLGWDLELLCFQTIVTLLTVVGVERSTALLSPVLYGKLNKTSVAGVTVALSTSH